MQFCPHDGTLLQVHVSDAGTPVARLQFFCPLCPYVHRPRHKHALDVPTTPKAVDDVMGGDRAWENVDQTAATCPACNHGQAYFMQLQIRSADEPMTNFFKCTNCGHRWNE
mmetsp:Transcript_11222/g.34601  ORF Transcript_11222/g.34601 Transcript_11222/m.34601 type:complete len:111 (+) Transcript_11222:288-620(+)